MPVPRVINNPDLFENLRKFVEDEEP